ncbi:hypothetical protein [Olleya sp. Bg11-27]|uniref:hypothetical protein n=1 Tax=Olleya sp. Bg11-27 TaxID=2058135 RepID=UPI000C2FF361|nr:hypothetical protein [Olleya sp. Bg11-27]AUC75471.1 hypothetical protein CW732_07185 [Olleya sp. Bg11-27]
MQNLKNLGQVLTKAEQQTINGGLTKLKIYDPYCEHFVSEGLCSGYLLSAGTTSGSGYYEYECNC